MCSGKRSVSPQFPEYAARLPGYESKLGYWRGFSGICALKSSPVLDLATMDSIAVAVKHVNNFKLCRSREGGNPVACVEKSLDPRLRGDDELNIFKRRINRIRKQKQFA